MHIEDSLKKVKIEEMKILQEILESRLPRSSHMYTIALTHERFPEELSFYHFGQLTKDETWIVCKYIREDFGPDFSFSSPPNAKMPNELKESLVNSPIIDWTKPYTFSVIDRNYSEHIYDISSRIKGNSTWSFPTNTYAMDSNIAKNMKIDLESTKGVEVKPLDNKGLEFILKTWKLTKEGTREHTGKCIQRNESSGVYVDGECVAGYTLGGSGAGLMSQVYTSKLHRKKGYAKICGKFLIKQMGEKGLTPYCGVDIHNEASNAFHLSIGLEFSHIADYIYFMGNNFNY